MEKYTLKLPALLRIGMLVFALMAASVPQPAAAQPSGYAFTQIAKMNDTFSYFEPAAINNRGDVLFGPGLNAGGEAVILWRKGQMTSIASAGQPLPGGGVMGYTLSPLAMNDSGDVAFIVTRDGPENVPSPLGFNAGVYRYDSRLGAVPVIVPGVTALGDSLAWGSHFVAAVTNRGEIFFPAMICSNAPTTIQTVSCPDGTGSRLTWAVYRADSGGTIGAVVKPGDPAPGGGWFDMAHGPAVNDRGDVAFTAHTYGENCALEACKDSLYVKRSPSGTIEPVARSGDPSPVPGKNYSAAFGAVINPAGDIVFLADLSAAGDLSEVAVFLFTRGKMVVIAKPGDPMPGGGTFMTAGAYSHNAYMNNQGEIAFVGTLQGGDNALYFWRKGTIGLVAKTGTPTGAGTISTMDDFGGGLGNTQIAMNDAGQIIFAAKFQEGGGGLLLANPR